MTEAATQSRKNFLRLLLSIADQNNLDIAVVVDSALSAIVSIMTEDIGSEGAAAYFHQLADGIIGETPNDSVKH